MVYYAYELDIQVINRSVRVYQVSYIQMSLSESMFWYSMMFKCPAQRPKEVRGNNNKMEACKNKH